MDIERIAIEQNIHSSVVDRPRAGIAGIVTIIVGIHNEQIFATPGTVIGRIPGLVIT